jgi:hypothetical protein
VSNPQPPIGLSQATAPSSIATGVVNSSVPSPRDYDHTIHLLRRSLAFPPSFLRAGATANRRSELAADDPSDRVRSKAEDALWQLKQGNV